MSSQAASQPSRSQFNRNNSNNNNNNNNNEGNNSSSAAAATSVPLIKKERKKPLKTAIKGGDVAPKLQSWYETMQRVKIPAPKSSSSSSDRVRDKTKVCKQYLSVFLSAYRALASKDFPFLDSSVLFETVAGMRHSGDIDRVLTTMRNERRSAIARSRMVAAAAANNDADETSGSGSRHESSSMPQMVDHIDDMDREVHQPMQPVDPRMRSHDDLHDGEEHRLQEERDGLRMEEYEHEELAAPRPIEDEEDPSVMADMDLGDL
jgi:hypothetical protein